MWNRSNDLHTHSFASGMNIRVVTPFIHLSMTKIGRRTCAFPLLLLLSPRLHRTSLRSNKPSKSLPVSTFIDFVRIDKTRPWFGQLVRTIFFEITGDQPPISCENRTSHRTWAMEKLPSSKNELFTHVKRRYIYIYLRIQILFFRNGLRAIGTNKPHYWALRIISRLNLCYRTNKYTHSYFIFYLQFSMPSPGAQRSR